MLLRENAGGVLELLWIFEREEQVTRRDAQKGTYLWIVITFSIRVFYLCAWWDFNSFQGWWVLILMEFVADDWIFVGGKVKKSSVICHPTKQARYSCHPGLDLCELVFERMTKRMMQIHSSLWARFDGWVTVLVFTSQQGCTWEFRKWDEPLMADSWCRPWLLSFGQEELEVEYLLTEALTRKLLRRLLQVAGRAVSVGQRLTGCLTIIRENAGRIRCSILGTRRKISKNQGNIMQMEASIKTEPKAIRRRSRLWVWRPKG
jgi:hypothetical protein